MTTLKINISYKNLILRLLQYRYCRTAEVINSKSILQDKNISTDLLRGNISVESFNILSKNKSYQVLIYFNCFGYFTTYQILSLKYNINFNIQMKFIKSRLQRYTYILKQKNIFISLHQVISSIRCFLEMCLPKTD